MSRWFVSGIDTGVGKTVVSCVLKTAIDADYWKPIQCGDLDNSDSMTVRSLSKGTGRIYTEGYRLDEPVSPNIAAHHQKIYLGLDTLSIPDSKRLVIEGAGGLLVPLNKKDYIIDIAELTKAKIVLVTRCYLGSINHTLLSVEAIRNRGLNLAYLVFNGERDLEVEQTILRRSGVQRALYLDHEDTLTPEVIEEYSRVWRKELKNEI